MEEDEEEEDEMVVICHRVEDELPETIEIRENQLLEHLQHGDTLGSCADDDNNDA